MTVPKQIKETLKKIKNNKWIVVVKRKDSIKEVSTPFLHIIDVLGNFVVIDENKAELLRVDTETRREIEKEILKTFDEYLEKYKKDVIETLKKVLGEDIKISDYGNHITVEKNGIKLDILLVEERKVDEDTIIKDITRGKFVTYIVGFQ